MSSLLHAIGAFPLICRVGLTACLTPVVVMSVASQITRQLVSRMRFGVDSVDGSWFNTELVCHHGKQAREDHPYHTMRASGGWSCFGQIPLESRTRSRRHCFQRNAICFDTKRGPAAISQLKNAPAIIASAEFTTSPKG